MGIWDGSTPHDRANATGVRAQCTCVLTAALGAHDGDDCVGLEPLLRLARELALAVDQLHRLRPSRSRSRRVHLRHLR